MIAIIDYDAGNTRSVEKAIKHLGMDVKITRSSREISAASGVILPGVGSYGDAMDKLKSYELIPVINELTSSKKPFMGICLGLQLLFDGSEEDGGVEGLKILEGDIVRFPSGELKVPHIGWNNLKIDSRSRLFKDLDAEPFVYFVHSYYLKANDSDIVSARTEYGLEFDSAIEKDNIFACQFHPEKSSHLGLKILSNFVNICKEKTYAH